MRRVLLAVSIAALAGPAALAQSVVIGTSHARACYLSAESGDTARRSVLQTCQTALADASTGTNDRASTYVNMGILLARSNRYDQAMTAYANALELKPDLAEAYQNRASIRLFHDRDAAAAERDYDRALDLAARNAHVAHLGRALAREAQDNLNGAYEDLIRALEIQPGWDRAEEELARYSVRSVNGANS